MKAQNFLFKILLISVLISSITFTSCDGDDLNSNQIIYRSDTYSLDTVGVSGQSLSLESSVWEIVENSLGGGDVFLSLKGEIEGDKILVQTFGDGLLNNVSLTLDEEKAFDEICQILFTSSKIESDTIVLNTSLSVIIETDTLFVTLRDTLTEDNLL